MANYHSIVRNWGEAESTFDTQLALGALEYKQQKYDANSSKIQETLNNYGNIGLLRDEEKQKLYNNLTQMVGTIEGVNGLDLSSNKITNTIMAEISKTIDEDLIKHHSLYKNKQKFDEEVEKARTEGKGRYSEVNHAYALENSGYNSYMEGETDSFGEIIYQDYIDEGQIAKDFQKLVKPYINTISRVTSEGETYLITEESKELTRQRIQDMVEATMSPEERRQITINTWNRYRGATPGELERDFMNYSLRQTDQYENILTDQRLLAESLQGDQKKVVEDQIEMMEERLVQSIERFENIVANGDKQTMYAALGMNEFNNKLIRAYEIDRDDILKTEIKYKPKHVSGGTKTDKDKDSERPENQITIFDEPLGEGERDALKEIKQSIETKKEDYLTTSVGIFRDLDPEVQEDLIAKSKRALGEEDPSQEALDEMVARQMVKYSNEGGNLLSAETAAALELKQIAYDLDNDKLSDKRGEVNKEFFESTMNRVFEERENSENFNVELGGEIVNVAQEISDREIFSVEDLMSRENLDLQAAILVEIEKFKREVTQEEIDNWEYTKGLVKTKFSRIGKNLKNFFTGNWGDIREAGYLEEHVGGIMAVANNRIDKINRVSEVYENLLGMDSSEAYELAKESVERAPLGVSEKIDPRVKKLRGALRTTTSFGGSHIEAAIIERREGLGKGIDIEALREEKEGNYDRALREALNEDQELVSRSVSISIFDTKSIEYRKALSRMQKEGVDIISGHAINIMEVPNGMVELRSNVRGKDGVEQVPVTVLKRNLEPDIQRLINLNRDDNMFTQDSFPEDTVGVARYTEDLKTVQGIANLLSTPDASGNAEVLGRTPNGEFSPMAISPGVVKNHFHQRASEYRAEIDKLGEDNNEENLYQRSLELITNIVEKADKPLKVGVTKVKDRYRGTSNHFKIYYEKDGKEEIVFQDMAGFTEEELTTVWKKIKYNPQSFTNTFINRLSVGLVGVKEIKKLEEYYRE